MSDLRFVISTDSHHVTEYDNIRWGAATARRGWVDRDSVINTLPLDEFMSFVTAKRS
jgi:DNA polymerase (family 10)